MTFVASPSCGNFWTDAAACLECEWEDFVAFYDFPEEHWTHLRTSNPIESMWVPTIRFAFDRGGAALA
jgi:putative transposase